jgi:hypothetical protein
MVRGLGEIVAPAEEAVKVGETRPSDFVGLLVGKITPPNVIDIDEITLLGTSVSLVTADAIALAAVEDMEILEFPLFATATGEAVVELFGRPEFPALMLFGDDSGMFNGGDELSVPPVSAEFIEDNGIGLIAKDPSFVLVVAVWSADEGIEGVK